jgi:hypothetical protein
VEVLKLAAGVLAVLALAVSAAPVATAGAAAPSNDAFSAAAPLTAGQDISSATLDATVEPGEPNPASVSGSDACAAFSDGPQCGASIWYTFTPATSGTVTIETCDRGTDLDTVLGVYTGATISAAGLVGANDDTTGCGGGFGANGSRVTFSATVGTTYHVDVSGFRGEMGSFYLRAYSGPGVARPDPDTAILRTSSFAAAANTRGGTSVLSGLRHTASFSFVSTPLGAAFECSLDGAAFAGCSSPLSFEGLTSGDHTFAVRASAGGATDPTPVIERFTIDTAPPETSLLGGPSGDTASSTAQWLLASSKRNGQGFNFACHFDGQDRGNCAFNQTFTSLCKGPHTFDAAAWDRAANLDATPVNASINVTTGTACAPPTVGATTATTPNPTTADIVFPLDNKGAGATVRVEYGKTTAYGQEVTFPSGPSGPGSAGPRLHFMDPGTLYHYRVTITTPFGTQSTADQTVTTSALGGTTLPAVQAGDPVAVEHNAARLPVTIDPAGVNTTYAALVEPAGHPVTNGSPTIPGDGTIPGTSTGPQAGGVSVLELEPGKSYDYRILARHQGSDQNEVLGPTRTFTTPDFSSTSGGSTGGGGGGGSTTTTTAVPVIGPTAGVASLAARTAKVTKGKVALRLRCSSAGPCAGGLEIDAVGASAARKKKPKKPTKTLVARGRYSVAAGATATVTVPLNAKGRKLLRKHHGKLTTKLVLSPADATATTSNLTLKQTATKRKKPKRKH